MHYIECVYIYCKRRVLDATAAGGSSSRRGVTCCAALPFVSSSLPRSFLVVSHALFSILHFALVLLSTLYIINNIYISRSRVSLRSLHVGFASITRIPARIVSGKTLTHSGVFFFLSLLFPFYSLLEIALVDRRRRKSFDAFLLLSLLNCCWK